MTCKQLHFSLLFVLLLIHQTSFSQQDSIPLSQNNNFRFHGYVGLMAGTSFIGSKNFAEWSNQVSGGNGMESKGFVNLGLQAMAVANHFAYGLSFTHESLFAPSTSGMSPGRTNVGFHFGASLNNPYKDHHIITTIGFGYSILDVNLHGNPPPILKRNILGNNAEITQAAFLLYPKVTVIKLLKAGSKRVKVGFDAGLEICVPGNYRYGYSVGSGRSSRFIGYILHGVPNFSPVTLCIGGFIGI